MGLRALAQPDKDTFTWCFKKRVLKNDVLTVQPKRAGANQRRPFFLKTFRSVLIRVISGEVIDFLQSAPIRVNPRQAFLHFSDDPITRCPDFPI